MSFYKKYELVRLLEKGEADRFQATDRATQQPVLLHLVPASSAGALADRLRSVKDSPKMIDFGEFAGFIYAVTAPSDPFPGLRDYFELQEDLPKIEDSREGDILSSAAPSGPMASLLDDVASQPAGRADEGGEFTRMFLAQREPVVEPAGNLLQDAKPEPAPQEGEFTRLFKSPLGGSKDARAGDLPAGDLLKDKWEPPTPATSPSALPQTPEPAPDHGEFTRIFGMGMPFRPAPPPPPPAVAPPTAKTAEANESDGFTRQFFAERSKKAAEPLSDDFEKFFGPGLKGGSIDMEKQSPSDDPTPETRPFKAVGEFTRRFGKGELEMADAPSPPPDNLSGIFAMPKLDKPKASEPPPPAPDRPRREETMGEYTRIIQRGALLASVPEAAPPPTPVAESPQEDAAKHKKKMIIGISVGVVVVLIAVIVIVLLLR